MEACVLISGEFQNTPAQAKMLWKHPVWKVWHVDKVEKEQLDFAVSFSISGAVMAGI